MTSARRRRRVPWSRRLDRGQRPARPRARPVRRAWVPRAASAVPARNTATMVRTGRCTLTDSRHATNTNACAVVTPREPPNSSRVRRGSASTPRMSRGVWPDAVHDGAKSVAPVPEAGERQRDEDRSHDRPVVGEVRRAREMDAGVQSRDRDHRQKKRDVHHPARRRVDPHRGRGAGSADPARSRYRMLVAMAPIPAGRSGS